MGKSTAVKETIISATIDLVGKSHGNVSEITTRMIADRANVGLGLINYHFQTKEKLMEICVQRMIGEVISSFRPVDTHYRNSRERLIGWAVQVFDFLFENQAVSRLSILGDLSHFSLNNNSDNSKKGFMLAIADDMDEREQNLLAFTLTSTMQTAFLANHISKEMLGYDLRDKAERDRFIADLVVMLYKDGDAKGDQSFE